MGVMTTMTKRIAAFAVGFVISLPSAASAECTYEAHHAGTHNGVVPEWSYAHVAEPTGEAVWEGCTQEAEESTCEHTVGMACAREMQFVYATCVGESVCDSWVQGQLEDGYLFGLEAIGSAYAGCVATVVAAGGEF